MIWGNPAGFLVLNRSAIVVGHKPAFFEWFKATGGTDETIRRRAEIAGRRVYLIPSCFYPEEIDEVVENIFAELFRREFASWQHDETLWPDTSDYTLFGR